jgi:hypothetical protein
MTNVFEHVESIDDGVRTNPYSYFLPSCIQTKSIVHSLDGHTNMTLDGLRSLGDVTNKYRLKSTTPITPSEASRERNCDKKSKMGGSWIKSKERNDKVSSIKPKDDEARRSNTSELCSQLV